MDCDDNDFKSQNLQLTGEGNTKYPPVLQSYALPKFDFDDNLHGNLRFDSLVETEVFLGIESNVDNHWIEDYSQGSSGIQFSSTTAETCSIPRCNNVWSEATSTESVEMLLKSVGQDENIPAQTIIKESDTCDELGCIVKKMEHSSKDSDNSLSKVEDVKDLQPIGPPDEISGEFSQLEDILGGNQPQAEDYSEPESVGGIIKEQVDYSVSGAEYHINQAAHEILGGNIIKSVDHLEHPIYPGSEVDHMEVDSTAEDSTDNMDEPSEIIPMEDTDFNKVEGSSYSVDSGNTAQVLECEDVFKDMDVVDETKINLQKLLPVTLEEDASSERHGFEISNIKLMVGENNAEGGSSTDNRDESSEIIPKGDTDFNKVEGRSDNVDSRNTAQILECKDVFKDIEAVDETKINLQKLLPVTLEKDASFKKHGVEISNIKPVEEENTADDSTDNMDGPSEIILKGDIDFHKVKGNSYSVDPRNTVQVPECDDAFKDPEAVDKTKINLQNLLPVTSDGDESSITHGVEISNIKPTDSEPETGSIAQTSPGLSSCTEKKDFVESGCQLDSTVIVGKSGDDVLHTITARSTGISEEIVVPVSSEFHECDKIVLVVEKSGTGLRAQFSNKESEVTGSTVINESGEGSNTDELIVSNSDATDQTQNKSGSAEALDTPNLASTHTNTDIPMPSWKSVIQIADHQDQKEAILARDLEHEGDTVTTISPEVRLSSLKSSLATTEIGSAEALDTPNLTSAHANTDIPMPAWKSVSQITGHQDQKEALPAGGLEHEGDTVTIISPEVGLSSLKSSLATTEMGHPLKLVEGSAEALDTPILASARTITDIPMPSWKSVSQIASHQDQKDVLPAVGSEHERETVTTIPPEVGLSCLKSSLVTNEIGYPLKLVEESHRTPQEGFVNQDSRESANKIEVGSVVSGATVRLVDGAEASVTVEKDEEAPVKEIHEEVSVAEQIPKDGEMSTQPVILHQNEPGNECQNGLGETEGPSVSREKNSGQDTAENSGGDAEKTSRGSLNSLLFSESNSRSQAPENETLCTDNGKSSCGSPTIIKDTIDLSHIDFEKARVKGSTDQNIPVAASNEKDSSNILSISPDLGRDAAFKVGDSFTFEVKSLGNSSIKEAATSWQPFPAMRATNLSPAVECSPSTSLLGQSDPKTPPGLSPIISPKVSSAKVVQSGSKERKPRRASAKASGKATPKNNLAKENTPVDERKSAKGNKTSMVSHSPSGIGQLVQSTEIQHGGVKPLTSASTLISGLPDLNTSSAPALFHQPFTDLQQVQLRAQIFVYGALIQGTAPDEAYMISAFGGIDGGKNLWDNAWRVCLDRLHGQKSYLTTPEQSRSGTRTNDQADKQSASQSNVSSTVGRASNKPNPSAVPSSLGPLSSPLWSIPTSSGDALQHTAFSRAGIIDYQQALTPLPPHQTPPVRNFVGHNPPWMSQSPFRAPSPWVGSPHTSAFDNIAQFPKSPNMETVKLTPVKESSVSHSGIKHGSTSIAQSVSSATVFGTTLLDTKKIIPGQQSTDPKPRKRKKNLVVEDQNQIVLNSLLHIEPLSTPLGGSILSPSVTVATNSSLVSKTPTEKFVMPVSFMTASVHLSKGDTDSEQRAKLSDESLGKLKEAKIHAEDAASYSAAAINHCQEIWKLMDQQKNSALEPDVETKLTSAAVAVAAAAAVAKAAAAAANVASEAALQAKLMAEEALSSSDVGNSSLKGAEVANSSSSAILAAREASRKRVKAATAASKQAENMDAILKAAELASEAVSQAGKIVAMSDPWRLSKLVEAGPENYWKVTEVSSDYMNRENLKASGDSMEISARQVEASTDQVESQTTNHAELLTPEETHSESMDLIRSTGDISSSVATSRKDKTGQEGRKDLVAEKLKENGFWEGALVEVFKDDGGFKAAWYIATILSLKDEKALVLYTYLLKSNKSSEKLKEWTDLVGEDGKAPKVRFARSMTAMPSERTRKRRRAALGDYTWFVGDRVDVWMQDSWREGVVTEKNKEDDTTLSVHFPAHGETSAVKVWFLRPSLMWKDGEWIEWSSSKGKVIASLEGDMPQEKRQRVTSPANEVKGKDKNIEVTESVKPDESSKLLDLSDNQKAFNLGKSTKDENKLGGLRTARTGLQKEGSRVVFGVPKQGKKRKFMDVSKHYTADKSQKVNEANDPVKFAKYLMPKGTGSKNTTKSEAKEKQAAMSKPRVLKSGKLQSFRTIPLKESSSASVSAHDNGGVTNNVTKKKNSVENTSGKNSSMEFGSLSSSEGAGEGPMVFSSTSDGPKKVSKFKSERANKGKLAVSGRMLPKIEEDKASTAKSTSEVVEPRRSVRKIHPTSRLLEGLQSSLIISKIPSFSDKGHRSQNKNNSRGNTHG